MINKVDKTLKLLYNSDSFTLFVTEAFDCGYVDRSVELLDNLMIKEGLIQISKDCRVLTAKGWKVSEQGGWLKYKEEKAKSVDERARRENEELKKLRYEVKLSRWQVKTFWPIFFLALIGGIRGIISLIMQIDSKTKQDSKVRQELIEANP